MDDVVLRLAALADWDTDPVLGDAEKALVTERAARADRYGLWPTDAGWEPTYDLWSGAALAWELKAAKAASRTDVTLGDTAMARAQVLEHCLAMVRLYGRHVVQSVRLVPARPGTDRWLP